MSDRILFSIGEALIDMIPSRVGCSFDEVPAFSPRVGGAPANVCAAVARLGGRSALLSQLGDDPFGHKIARALAGCGVELSHLEFTSKASTALAFVSLAENGERTFSFCRKPSADLLYAPEQIDPGWFSQAFALHFCSVSLVDSPMRYAHLAAITAAREAGAILWGPLVQQLTKDFIPGFAVAFAIGTYIDLKAMGDGFARLCGVKNENGLLFHILRVASITFVMAVLMSLVMMFLAVGYTMPAGAFFMAYLMSFPLTYVVALVVAFITFAFGMPLTIALCRKPPKMPTHP